MLIFLWLFITVFVISYLSIYDYLSDRDTFWAIIFNLIFLGLSIKLTYNAYVNKEKKQMILFALLILFITLTTTLIIIS